MKLKPGELRIYYNLKQIKDPDLLLKQSINFELDRALEELLAEFGYTFYGGGTTLETNVRDQCYEKIEDEPREE